MIMGFLRNLFKKKKNIEEESIFEHLDTHIHNDEERQRFVSTSVMQMKEISSDIDDLRLEYNAITSYLNDCDEIDRIPKDLRIPIEDIANDIITIKENKEKYYLEKPLMEQSLYDKMDRLSDDYESVYEKIKDTEKFQSMIKSDLKKVEGEKQAYYYRRHELKMMLNNIVGVLIIATVAFVFCMIALMVLMFSLSLNVKLGFLLSVTLICVVYSFLFLKGNDLRKESIKLDKTIVKIIQLQNSVKIRLVNNTNLLDYLYIKYDVDSSKELKEKFELYLEEKHRIEQYEQANKELPMANRKLLLLLKNLPLNDPVSWVHNPEAIVDRKELVEIRHEMIGRRQKLRDQIDENTALAQEIKNDIKCYISRYPKYSNEVMHMMEELEKE